MQGMAFTAIIAAEKFTITRRFMLDKGKDEGKDQESKQLSTIPVQKVTKTQESTTHKRTKRSSLSSR